MKELCSSGFHYPFAPLLRLRPWGIREEKLFWGDTLEIKCLSFVTQKAAEREWTCLSQIPVQDPLFRGELCFKCPKHSPWKMTCRHRELPQVKWPLWVRFIPWDSSSQLTCYSTRDMDIAKYSCTQPDTTQCLKMQTAATLSICWSPPALLHC